jgi:hypothetical protein
VAARENLTFEYKVSQAKGGKLSWAFYTEGYDIQFSLYCENERKFLIEKKKVLATENKKERGEAALTYGNYTITFDNSHSRTRSKTLHYWLSMTTE